MVRVTVPVVAVGFAVSVSVLVVAVGLGLNVPARRSAGLEGDRVTLPVKPFCGETVMVLEPLLPWVTVRLLGEADRVKSGAAWAFTRSEERRVGKERRAPVMVTENVHVVAVALVVIVTVTVPVAAVLLAVSVSVLVVVVGFGSKAGVTPSGSPAAERVTLPVKPFSGETEIVLEPLLPWVTATLLGEADRVKSGAAWAFTVRVSVVVLVRVPEAPVTVTLTV